MLTFTLSLFITFLLYKRIIHHYQKNIIVFTQYIRMQNKEYSFKHLKGYKFKQNDAILYFDIYPKKIVLHFEDETTAANFILKIKNRYLY
jgi:hypothetical protein